VEGTLEEALQKILQERPSLQAASRTDRGVHARGQVVNFLTSNPVNLFRLKGSLNSLLPPTIRILEAEEMELNFHPTTDALGKEYLYYVTLGDLQSPFDAAHSYHFPNSVNLPLMQEAISHLLGERDFAAFTNAGETREDTVRHLEKITIEGEDTLCFTIQGKSFLYKMVRNLVGTLLYVGSGKISLSELPEMIAAGDRKRTGITAPAHGLFLEKVLYSTLVP